MKKIILLSIMFISLIGNINAQDSTKVELTKETIYKDVKNALSQLGDALKVGAEHVYEILVRQQVVSAITYLLIGILSSIVLYIGIKMINYCEWRNGDVCDKDAIKLVCGVIFIMVSGIAGIAFLMNINTIVTGFVNPEYGAIKEIMELIK